MRGLIEFSVGLRKEIDSVTWTWPLETINTGDTGDKRLLFTDTRVLCPNHTCIDTYCVQAMSIDCKEITSNGVKMVAKRKYNLSQAKYLC